MSDQVRIGPILAIFAALFFVTGLVASQNELLNPLFKNVFSLKYAEAALIQFVYFGVYVLLAIPMGKLAIRFGYKRCLQLALLASGIGALLFFAASQVGVFSLFLVGVMVMAMGNATIIILGNPYIALISPPEKTAPRLNVVNGFYMVGTTTGPFLGGLLYVEQVKLDGIGALGLPYILLGGLLVFATFLFVKAPLPSIREKQLADDEVGAKPLRLLSDTRLMLGILAMFVYVGAEIGAASKIVDWLGQPEIMNLTAVEAGRYLTLYWGLTMVLRFTSVALMKFIKPVNILIFNALFGVACVVIACVMTGFPAGIAIVLLGAANAVMFPTIFALSTSHLGSHTQKGGSYVLMAVAGGAFIPLIIGALTDWQGLRAGISFLIFCYGIIAVFGLFVKKAD
ncbi:MAG: MFS transporter [Bacteroidia bacterium]